MRLRELLAQATERLGGAGVPSPAVDARALLEYALDLDRAALLVRGEAPVDPAAEARETEQKARAVLLAVARAAHHLQSETGATGNRERPSTEQGAAPQLGMRRPDRQESLA